jgi:hypothetical protein
MSESRMQEASLAFESSVENNFLDNTFTQQSKLIQDYSDAANHR